MVQHKSFLKVIGIKFLILFSAFALLAPLLANHRPLYINYKGHHFFPAFSLEHSTQLKRKNWIMILQILNR